MFNNMPYDHLIGASFHSNHSTDSAFSDGSSASWDSSTVSSHVYTPASTPRRGSPPSVKRECPPYAAPTPASTPDRYGSINGFCAMNALTQDMMSGYQTSLMYENPPPTTSNTQVNMASLGHYGSYLDASMCHSFGSNNGLPMGTPALDHELYSPISDMGASTPLPESCVAPSQTVQTTFMDAFGVQSPAKSLQFSMSYDVPAPPDYDAGLAIDNSSPQSMRCAFQRKEHLKRHINTVHKITKTVPCEFCGKEFGRNDNLKAHTLLHGQPNKNKRTLYYPGALQRWYEMSKKPRKVAGAKKIKEEGDPLAARSRALGY
ncbi:transcription factor steA [Diplocarpon rosae]|nr:transcription factor steA [Diplocarpon rosae]